MRKKELITALIIFLVTLWLWSLPFQKDRLPYGEVDAGSHFAIADYMGQNDKATVMLPYYLDMRYGGDNMFIPHALYYAPPYHVNFAAMQILSGDRFLSVFLLVAIMSSSIVLISFFIMNKLYGYWAAILSSSLLIFSMRDIMVYLWGQWPQQISFAIVPLVLYSFYAYCNSLIEGDKKPIYLYITSILLAINFILHPAGIFYSAIGMIVFFTAFIIKERKEIRNIFSKLAIKEVSIAVLFFIIPLAIFPLQTGNVIVGFSQTGTTSYAPLSTLFHWSKDPKLFEGALPPAFFSYSQMHGLWTLPLLLLGLLVLLFRRKKQDLFILSWLAAVYILLHLDIIGKGDYSGRGLQVSAQVFSPLVALGVLSIPQFIKPINRNLAAISKYLIVVVFLIMVIMINGKAAYGQLNNAYSVPLRLTPAQYDAAEWMRINLGDHVDVEIMGTLDLKKQRWIQYVSQRHINHINKFDENITSTHLFLDYSDAALLSPYYPQFKQQMDSMKAYESNLTGAELLYDKNNIRVYKLANN